MIRPLRFLSNRQLAARASWVTLLLIFLLLAVAAGCASLQERERQWIFQPGDRAWGNSASQASQMSQVWIEFDSKVTGLPARLSGLWLAAMAAIPANEPGDAASGSRSERGAVSRPATTATRPSAQPSAASLPARTADASVPARPTAERLPAPASDAPLSALATAAPLRGLASEAPLLALTPDALSPDASMHALASDAPLLLFLHGSRWNVVGSSPRIRRMQELGFSVLAIDYRGFGKSTAGLPSEATAYEDARAAWDWLASRYPGRPRYIFGHSLGGAVAIELASTVNDESGTIVEGTFTSIRDAARSFKWGWLPIGPFITQRFESVDKVGRLGAPLLVVHGDSDRLILPELGRRLFEAAAEPKAFVLVQGGSHYSTNTMGQQQYRAAISRLFGLGGSGESGATRTVATSAGPTVPGATPMAGAPPPKVVVKAE